MDRYDTALERCRWFDALRVFACWRGGARGRHGRACRAGPAHLSGERRSPDRGPLLVSCGAWRTLRIAACSSGGHGMSAPRE